MLLKDHPAPVCLESATGQHVLGVGPGGTAKPAHLAGDGA